MSIGKYILIDPGECPSRKELIDGVERLHKCSDIFSRFTGKNDPDPDGLRRVASFLEQLLKDNRLKQQKLTEGEEAAALDRIEKAKRKK